MKSIQKSQKIVSRGHFSSGFLKSYLDNFIHELSKNGFTKFTIDSYTDSVSHFATWLQNKNIQFNEINNKIVANFSKHHCNCLGYHRKSKLSHRYIKRVQYFISYLSNSNSIFTQKKVVDKKLSPTLIKFKESLQFRGLSEATISKYENSVLTLLPSLGKNPKKYNAISIRQVIVDATKKKKKSRCFVKHLTTALRAYLRFLILEGLCSPDLDKSVPTVADWKLSSLPKYITVHELEQLIASCNLNTHQGLRDHAIILLLSRLGLRAGEVSNMRIDDINWDEGTLRVCGKGRKEIILPLPQEVGDSLLSYIEKARPPIPIEKLFLCLNAPHRSFPSSSGISNIVSAALLRAGLSNTPSRGAHLLRHTAATHMLRKGATLEAVSTVLRHKTLDMTGYYAKVDIPRLKKIAQPWPEVTSC